MNEDELIHVCPQCRSGDAPKLIVRGPGRGADGLSLQCRHCECEWSDERSSLQTVNR